MFHLKKLKVMDKLMKETIIKMLIGFSFQPQYSNLRKKYEINDYDEDEENICSIEFVFHPIVNISLQTTEGVMEISEFHIAVTREKQTAVLLMKICNSDKYSYAEFKDLLDINELFTKLNNLKTEYL